MAAALLATGRVAGAALTNGQRLADAARAQVGVTTGYDPTGQNWLIPAETFPGQPGCAQTW